MNSIFILLFGVAWFLAAYFIYGKIVDRRVIQPDDKVPTPALSERDGVDFVTTPKPILFGHHFSSIAGAGPIVGPIIAYSLFGWGGTLIWILVGTAFIGMIHDYFSLMVSVRNRGISITEISQEVISPLAKWMFSIFVWLALVLVIAVFSDITAKTLANKPEIAVPTLGLIGVAVFFGMAVYRWKLKLLPATIISWVLIFLLVQLGYMFPLVASYYFWFVVFIVYAYIASSLPVWILLQPRDYLSMTILFVGLILGYLGMLVLRPPMNGPVYTVFVSDKKPIIPMLFVIVACGAISGFHSLVASGTTAKQLNRESSGRFVGAGGMIFEGVLALLVLLLVGGALFWDKGPPGLTDFVFADLMKQGPIVAFGSGFGRAASSIGIPLDLAAAFGILMLNAFVLTSLDTAVRLSRFVFQESLFRRNKLLSNRWIAGLIGVLLALFLALTNSYKVIWPIFGSANQLIAALALFTVTAYFAGRNKPTLFSLIPALFMWVVTEISLVYLLVADYGAGFLRNSGDTILAVAAVFLAVLGGIVGWEAVRSIRRSLRSI